MIPVSQGDEQFCLAKGKVKWVNGMPSTRVFGVSAHDDESKERIC
jgi:hypothetical protein